MDLKPNQLRLIAAIAGHGQLQLAARDLSITQPAASRMLSEIEEMAGSALFERHPKGMILTPVGQVVARRANSLLVEMRDLTREVRDLRLGRSGVVRVGAVTGPAIGYLVPAIQQLKAASPEVEVTVEVSPSLHLIRDLDAGNLDFVVGRLLPDSNYADFDVYPGRHEEVGILARRDHPLSQASGVRLHDLVNYEWVIQDRGTPIRQAVETAFGQAGVGAPLNIVNTSSLLLMIALLSQSNVVAPMALEVAHLMTRPPVNAGFTVIDLAEEIVVPPYFVLASRGRSLSPVAKRMMALVLSEMSRPAAPGSFARL